MTCTALQSELSQLRQQRGAQEDAIALMQGHGGPGMQFEQAELDRINAEISSTQAALDLCLAQQEAEENPTSQQILGTVDNILCKDASKQLGSEKPYLLIASFDMANSAFDGLVGLIPPLLNVVKVGPWEGVGGGERHFVHELTAFNQPPFWNLSGEAATIAHPQDIIFLVAFMEHDASSPDTIRSAVKTALIAALLSSVNLTYTAYVTTMVSTMTGAINLARMLPSKVSPNLDDLIGEVQQLSLTANELATLNVLRPVTKTLNFTQRKPNKTVQNDYTVTFNFTV